MEYSAMMYAEVKRNMYVNLIIRKFEMCLYKYFSISSCNGVSTVRRQAITRTYAHICSTKT